MPTPLTYGASTVNDGTGTPVSGGVETFTDPARSNAKGAVVAIRTADGQDLAMGQATKTNSLPVTIASDQNIALETGGNLATIAAAQGAQGTGLNPPTGGSGILGFLSGILNKLSNALIIGAGSAIIGKVGIDQTTPGTTNAVQAISGTTGGNTPYHLISAASTNTNSVKGSAGQVYGLQLVNTSTTQAAYVKLFDKATAPTLGTDTPKKVICLPAATSTIFPTVVIANLGNGNPYLNGIAIAITGGLADNDATAIAANAVICDIDFK